MNQRRLVWRALKEAGVVDSDDPKVQDFLQHMRNNPARCWADLVSDFRAKHYDIFDKVVPALQSFQDPAIRNALIKFCSSSKAKEKQLLTKIASDTDLDQDPLAGKRLRGIKIKPVQDVIKVWDQKHKVEELKQQAEAGAGRKAASLKREAREQARKVKAAAKRLQLTKMRIPSV